MGLKLIVKPGQPLQQICAVPRYTATNLFACDG